MNIYLKIMSPITVLGALIHDLGKASVSFQKKLAHELDFEPVRHETMSFLMAAELFGSIGHFETPEALREWCNTHLQKRLAQFLMASPEPEIILEHIRLRINERLCSQHWRLENVGLTSALWLALCHHRLPEGADNEELDEAPWVTFTKKEGYFIRMRGTGQPPTSFDEVRENLQFPSSDLSQKGLPWNNLQWCKAVLAQHKKIQLATRQLGKRSIPFDIRAKGNPFTQVLALMGRSALVFADYRDSYEKIGRHDYAPEGEIFANTLSGMFADSLDEHLLHTGTYAEKLFKQMFLNKRTLMDKAPTLSRTIRARKMKGLKFTSDDPRYQWQNRIHEQLAPQASDQPFFGCVIGKTGSGKTRGNVLTMHAMKKTLRFTCAIGLRALVQQTFDAYQETFIGLDKTNVALLIGERGQAKADPQAMLDAEAKGHDPLMPEGTGNDIKVDNASLGDSFEIRSASRAEHPLEFMFDPKKQAKLITTPVQVLTIDHLMSGASLDLSSGLKQLFHLMSTDIIADEIDDYDPKSLPAISRMAFISGFFGRSFIISSATASRVIIHELYNAWYLGVQKRQAIHYGIKPRVVLVSHVPGFETLLVKPEDFKKSLWGYLKGVGEHSAHVSERKHAVKIAQISKVHVTTIQKEMKKQPKFLPDKQCWEILDKAILGMHKEPHIGVTVEGVKLSTGFIRFTHIKSAQYYAAWLNLQVVDGTLLVPFCYHSKLYSAERKAIEEMLLSINTRKGKEDISGDDVIFSHPFVAQVVAKARMSGTHNIVFVLCTTNIIETGRDHDYDFCLLEPSSTRSMVQAAGRVWRHRRKQLPGNAHNGLIMSSPIRNLLDEPDSQVWRYPGIEDSQEEKNIPGVLLYRFCDIESQNDKMKRMGHLLKGLDVTVGRPAAAMRMDNKHLMNTNDLWYHDFSRPQSKYVADVHAGMCFGIPDKDGRMIYAKSVMSWAELANQAMNLSGIPRLKAPLRFNWPHGLHYSTCNMAMLNANHPKKRVLREAEENVTIFPDNADVNTQGTLGSYWRVRVQNGAGKLRSQSSIEIPILRFGDGSSLWLPDDLPVLMARYGLSTTEMAAPLTIRQTEFENILVAEEGCCAYVPGLGLVSHPEILDLVMASSMLAQDEPCTDA
ncbi:CRISPR-associated protein Cas3 [Pseudomonas fluorescens]|uniref:CRISPR-associated protein Cas3 n=1 Tax=Pseudomonas TaxID=286 RepID=UPI00177ECEE7|nr:MULTISPECIES: CRISPR-associated protein Cas3 [Pseudomonas]MBD8088716.1 CRISPR-associated protein Cas3 [Pseudomonas fluorescens]MBD8681493.1 CRISPR-associated protein Cas3 [Pseudomonas sp. CFBP 13719]